MAIRKQGEHRIRLERAVHLVAAVTEFKPHSVGAAEMTRWVMVRVVAYLGLMRPSRKSDT